MHTVTLDAIEAPRVRLRRDVAALLKKCQGLLMTVAAHLERRAGIRSGDEASYVSFALLSLGRITSVAVVASHAHTAVCAGVKNCHYLACLLLKVARDAIVLALGNDRTGFAKERGSGKGQPEAEDGSR